MVYRAQLAPPSHLTTAPELPVDTILQSQQTAEPIQTRHQSLPMPIETPTALHLAELVYVKKGSQLPSLAQSF